MEQENFRLPLKYMNKAMVFMWKLGLADWLNIWPQVFGRFVVITHVGRKTGKIYHNMVNYADLDGEIYCAAGFGTQTDWYKNIKANPQIEVWLKDGWWLATAEEVKYHPDQINIMRSVLIGSGIVAPLIGINPKELDDQSLADITKDYCLIHLKRIREKTGPDGPNQYAWIWPFISIFLALALIKKGKRK